MNAQRIIGVVAIVAIVFTGFLQIMSIAAQEPVAQWPTPELYKVGNAVNLRQTASANSGQMGQALVGGYVEVNFSTKPGDPENNWMLVRLFDAQAKYVKTAWLNEKVANLQKVDDATKAQIKFTYPRCEIKGTGVLITAPVANTLRFDSKTYVMDSVANGCSLLGEGRQDLTEAKHHVWILRANGLANKSVLAATNGFFTYAEASIWAFDTGWNMDQDPNPLNKPSIGLEFVIAKRQNMLNADKPYNWPIVLHKLDGTTVEFGTGENDVPTPNPENASCRLTKEPRVVPVNGILDTDTKSFTASIGQTGCNTLVLVRAAGTRNWTAEIFDKTHENVDLQDEVLAVEFPFDWDAAKMAGWLTNDNLKALGLLVGDTVTPQGIDVKPITIS